MADPYLAQIMLFAGNFAPRNWALCNGDKVAISQNTALFSLIGTLYGGDGRSYFNLPNLPGLTVWGNTSNVAIGSVSGSPTVTLDVEHMANHYHMLMATTSLGNTSAAAGAMLATSGEESRSGEKSGIKRYSTGNPGTTMSPQSIGPSGSGGAHNNMQPYLSLTYCICMLGVFPPRP